MYTLIKVVFFIIYGSSHQFALHAIVYIIYQSALKSALTKSNLFNIVSFSSLLCLFFRSDGKLLQPLCLSMFLKGLFVLLFCVDACFVSRFVSARGSRLVTAEVNWLKVHCKRSYG